MPKHAHPRVTVLQHFDSEATAATAVGTPAKNYDADDAQSVSTLYNLTTSFTDNINHLQQRCVSVPSFCSISKWASKELQKCASVRTHLPSGAITNKAVKITVPEDSGSLEIVMLASPFVSDAK